MLDVTPRLAELAPRRALAAANAAAAVVRLATACSFPAIRFSSAGPPASDSSTATSAACRRGGVLRHVPAFHTGHLSQPPIQAIDEVSVT